MFRARKLLLLLLTWYTSSTLWLVLRFSFYYESSEEHAIHRHLQSPDNQHHRRNTVYRSQPSRQHKLHNFGLVLRQFAKRVLSRHITSSNVLIVSPDATFVAMEMNSKAPKRRVDSTSLSVGGNFLVESAREGHTVHAISGGNRWWLTLDDWWRSFDHMNSNNVTILNESVVQLPKSDSATPKPSWILLAVFDSPLWMEDLIWKNSKRFLLEGTVTYIVLGMHSMKLENSTYRFGGLTAVEMLLQRRYKLQTLSASHYFADHDHERKVFDDYGPNALFQSLGKVEDFLKWGADAASRFSGGNKDRVFSSYLFATQGLDLAIPDPRVYLKDDSKSIVQSWSENGDIAPLLKTCTQQSPEEVNFDLYFDDGVLRLNQSKSEENLRSWSFNGTIPSHKHDEFTVWIDGDKINDSEVACVKHRKTGQSKCITRILETNVNQLATINGVSDNDGANILVILLDPISRSHFRRLMPQSARLLEELGFIHFPNYTAVGPNSGPNQAALYSGIPLQQRNGIGRDIKGVWLWDRLRNLGYITLKAEDNCIENSNMIQSLAPNTSHGMGLHGLFCFDSFSRPNCIGPDSASSLLLTYGDKFISTYENCRKTKDGSLRWAALLHLTDSHEDSMLLGATVDHEVSSFLNKMSSQGHLDSTVVVLCSDHGLHYGPFFPSKSGRREATEPILHIKIPSYLQAKLDMEKLKRNARLYTTPFDVHETLLQFTQTSNGGKSTSRKGRLLTENFQQDRQNCQSVTDLIPAEYCKFQEDKQTEITIKEVLNGYPTIDSFFLDIPSQKRPRLQLDAKCHEGRNEKSRESYRLCNDSSDILP